jgi:hypothetical protein
MQNETTTLDLVANGTRIKLHGHTIFCYIGDADASEFYPNEMVTGGTVWNVDGTEWRVTASHLFCYSHGHSIGDTIARNVIPRVTGRCLMRRKQLEDNLGLRWQNPEHIDWLKGLTPANRPNHCRRDYDWFVVRDALRKFQHVPKIRCEFCGEYCAYGVVYYYGHPRPPKRFVSSFDVTSERITMKPIFFCSQHNDLAAIKEKESWQRAERQRERFLRKLMKAFLDLDNTKRAATAWRRWSRTRSPEALESLQSELRRATSSRG